jgi:hypothetical protein
MAFPPPDSPYDVPQLIRATDVYVQIVGFLHDEPDVEILARSGDDFFRFCVPKHARVVREFWKNIGVTNIAKLPEGAYQDERGGCGPYTLSGMVVGEDVPVEEPPEVTESLAEPDEEADTDEHEVVPAEEPEDDEDTVVSVGTKVLVGVTLTSEVEKDAVSRILTPAASGIVPGRK